MTCSIRKPVAPSAGYQPRAEGGVLSYNEFWYERGVDLTSDKRTSLIIDPPDGRLPPLTEEARTRNAERQAYLEEHRYDSYEDRSLMGPLHHGLQLRATDDVWCL